MTPLYVYTKAARLANAVATNTTDLAALITANADPLDPDNATTLARISATIPEITLGDSEPFTVYFYDSASTIADWSGVAGNTVGLGLGLLDLNGDQLLSSATLTTTTNGFTGRLSLNTSTLITRVQAAITGGFGKGRYFESPYKGATFPIHLRRIDSTGRFETYAMWDIFVRDRVLTSAPADSDSPTTSSYWTIAQARQYLVQNGYFITSLTGSGAAALDGLATINGAMPTGAIYQLAINNFPQVWQLQAGTAAEDGLTVVRPDDYNASTNARIWQLLA